MDLTNNRRLPLKPSIKAGEDHVLGELLTAALITPAQARALHDYVGSLKSSEVVAEVVTELILEEPVGGESSTRKPESKPDEPEIDEVIQVANALETIILDPKKRDHTARQLTWGTFEYRMATLDAALGGENRPQALFELQAMLSQTPQILLLPAAQFDPYVQKLKEVVTNRKNLSPIDEEKFSATTVPEAFAGIDSLGHLNQKILKKAEYDRLKNGLGTLGLNPIAAMAVVRFGFFYQGKLFFGTNGIPEEKMIKRNIAVELKGNVVPLERDIERAFRYFLKNRVILSGDKMSFFSLNTALDGTHGPSNPNPQENEVLKGLLRWLLKHNHTKEHLD